MTVKHNIACSIGYLENGSYVSVNPTENADGSYSFAIPLGIDEVLLTIKGDVNLDGRITAADIARLNAHILGKRTLTAEEYFAGDVNCDGNIANADIELIAATVLRKAAFEW